MIKPYILNAFYQNFLVNAVENGAMNVTWSGGSAAIANLRGDIDYDGVYFVADCWEALGTKFSLAEVSFDD